MRRSAIRTAIRRCRESGEEAGVPGAEGDWRPDPGRPRCRPMRPAAHRRSTIKPARMRTRTSFAIIIGWLSTACRPAVTVKRTSALLEGWLTRDHRVFQVPFGGNPWSTATPSRHVLGALRRCVRRDSPSLVTRGAADALEPDAAGVGRSRPAVDRPSSACPALATDARRLHRQPGRRPGGGVRRRRQAASRRPGRPTAAGSTSTSTNAKRYRSYLRGQQDKVAARVGAKPRDPVRGRADRASPPS